LKDSLEQEVAAVKDIKSLALEGWEYKKNEE
jgi:hypothetical protein